MPSRRPGKNAQNNQGRGPGEGQKRITRVVGDMSGITTRVKHKKVATKAKRKPSPKPRSKK